MKILCFGDSNTYGYDPRSFWGERYLSEDRWVDILAGKLNCAAINAGENGREIPHNPWEMAEFQRLLEAEKTIDLLIVMLGTNDLLQGNSFEAIEKRMEVFLRQISMNSCQILLVAPPILQPGEWVASRGLIEASKVLNETYRKLANGLGVGFVDAGEWNLPLAFDGVHLTQEGHRAFADGMLRYFRKGE